MRGEEAAASIRASRATHSIESGKGEAEMRQLAVDAHEILNRPDATTGELVRMRRRSWELLHGARASQLSEIERWLRSAVRMLDAKLLSRPVAQPEGAAR